MAKEEIKEINNHLCNELNLYDQGIFVQPTFIPTDIKEPVIYTRYETGGYSGGSCWNDNPASYSNKEMSTDKFKVLDVVLEKLCPQITYLQYKKIDSMIHTNEETEREYYGNSTDWKVEYIILSELENYITSLK